jgi:hypothetical protein
MKLSVACAVLTLTLAAASCSDDSPPVADTPASAGTAGGLSPEQIRNRAEPMTVEQAESLGIIDTTIHLESSYPEEAIPTDTIDTVGPDTPGGD